MRDRTNRIAHCVVLLSIVGLFNSGFTRDVDAAAADELEAGFRDPPREARPSTYWLWLNGYVNRSEVERELQALFDGGIRGVLIFDMGARGDAAAAPPAGPPFLSDRSVADIAHTVRIAGRLGMDVQLSVASSWDMGGAWVEPRHASMGLFQSEISVDGPAEVDQVLPLPTIPARAPRGQDGRPLFRQEVALLAIPVGPRLPGHDFIFKLDPPARHTLDHAVLHNTLSDNAAKYGELHLFAKDFSIAVSDSPAQDSFQDVLRGSLRPTTEPQRFDLDGVKARYVRLRILNGHNPEHDRVTLGEFQLFNNEQVNVAGSHVADRTRHGAELLTMPSALGKDRNWTAENIHDGALSGPGGSWSSAGLPPALIQDPTAVVDLVDHLEADGRLKWRAPQGRWLIQRYVCLNTGERLKVPSPNSDGLATDHFSREATRVFLEHLIERLRSQLGDLKPTALKQLYLASYEVRGATWTPDMTAQFRRYRGYDMIPYLPVLSGNVVADAETTQRFLYDYRKTLGDLLVDAYYRAAVDAAHAAGLGIESEAGGPGPPIHQVPVDALKAQGAIDEIRGEFWPRRPTADGLWVVKETACAGHIYGKRRIHMEAFTGFHHWQDGPFDLKPSADRAFCEGANHFVWHTSSHQPPEAGQPGWVYGAGTHLNTNLIWWPKAKPFLDYLARCSFLLQQGHFVADVCYYYGDQGYNFVPPKHVDPSLGYGYDYDVTNREVILTRMSVRDGRITLPDGMSYALLVLPERQDIDLEVLKKLEQMIRDGATVVGPKPTRTTGLADRQNRDRQVRQLADRIWGPCDGKAVRENTYGRGRVIWGRTLREILSAQGTGPDFGYTADTDDVDVDFIHRRTDTAEIYFVRNKQPRWVPFEAVFRARGRVPERWDPVSGQISPRYAYRPTGDTTAVRLQLEPYGSTFVVFRRAENRLPGLQVTRAGDPVDRDAVRVNHWDGKRASLQIAKTGEYRVATDDGRSVDVTVGLLPVEMALLGPWEVRFDNGPKTPAPKQLDKLIPWTEHADEAVRYFSGVGTYRHNFTLTRKELADDHRWILDLGDLWAVGEVYLNDRSLGVLWKPPYTVDITDAVKSGSNELRIEIANTWSNRLVGDAQGPESERVTRTNITVTGGKRWRDAPLLPSGLFGPVRLVPQRIVETSP